MKTYTATVGLEVHAELKTKSKMFCGCTNAPHAQDANTHVCPVCMAHPGTLPVVNKEAVFFLMQMGTAIGGTLAEYSEFDRKNYFYPDIPKAYQISQYKFPFVTGGSIGGVEVTRVHLEEDTARSVHDQGEESLVDFNRAGVPLMELVTEPVIHTAVEAGKFARELQLLLRTLGLSDANMEKGEMRVEANISISSDSSLGTKVEVKNLNSFKSVESAILYEIERQKELLEKNETIRQETRGWDEIKNKTFLQRVKETSEDYRYFPDPDIPKFSRQGITEFSNSRIAEIMLETPNIKRSILASAGIDENYCEIIISDIGQSNFFFEALKILPVSVEAKLAANYFVNDLMSIVSLGKRLISEAHVSKFVDLLTLVARKEITSRVAKDLLLEVVFDAMDPILLANERGLLQDNSTDSLLLLVKEVIEKNPTVVAEYKAGKTTSIQFLVGQAMKASKGSANPAVLIQLLTEKLG